MILPPTGFSCCFLFFQQWLYSGSFHFRLHKQWHFTSCASHPANLCKVDSLRTSHPPTAFFLQCISAARLPDLYEAIIPVLPSHFSGCNHRRRSTVSFAFGLLPSRLDTLSNDIKSLTCFPTHCYYAVFFPAFSAVLWPLAVSISKITAVRPWCSSTCHLPVFSIFQVFRASSLFLSNQGFKPSFLFLFYWNVS